MGTGVSIMLSCQILEGSSKPDTSSLLILTLSNLGQVLGLLVPPQVLAKHIVALALAAYQPRGLRGALLVANGRSHLGGASRLDAFSAYPVRTWAPSCATGVTTGAPSVRPPRSSRTRGALLKPPAPTTDRGPNCLTTF